MATAKEVLRRVADNAAKTKSESEEDIQDQIFNELQRSASKGMYGSIIQIQEPEFQSGYVANVVGDLRSGGLTVDLVNVKNSLSCIIYTLLVTW